jgi:murein DD-endopeptidase MepM/ murein hydrolase activator NlpD
MRVTHQRAESATNRPAGRRRGLAAGTLAATAALLAVALWPTPASLHIARTGHPGVATATTTTAHPTPAAPAVTRGATTTAARIELAYAKLPLVPPVMPAPRLLPPHAAIPDADTSNTDARDTEKERVQAREIAALRRQLAAQRAQLTALQSAKAPMLRILDQQSRRGVEQARRVIALTGLDADKLLARSKPPARGGLDTVTRGFGLDRFDANARAVARRIARWQRLQRLLERLPLVAPLDHYRKTSNFGKRKDPINKRVRRHNGTDFAYYRGAPVRATAAGKVVFAGRRGGFGNMVEIDHGQGIRTRYAHLYKPLVHKGDTVSFRQQIGELGSTGHSTGPHVHYEILVRGRAVDPMNFITAGKYAFKPVPRAQLVAVHPEDEKRDGRAFRKALLAKVDATPAPRAAASMVDRPDPAAWPGIAALDAKRGNAPTPDRRVAELSQSLIYAAGIEPTLRPRRRYHYRKRHHRRRWRHHRRYRRHR